jgi:hypothetical protein
MKARGHRFRQNSEYDHPEDRDVTRAEIILFAGAVAVILLILAAM